MKIYIILVVICYIYISSAIIFKPVQRKYFGLKPAEPLKRGHMLLINDKTTLSGLNVDRVFNVPNEKGIIRSVENKQQPVNMPVLQHVINDLPKNQHVELKATSIERRPLYHEDLPMIFNAFKNKMLTTGSVPKKYAVPDVTSRHTGSVPEMYGLRDIIHKLAGSVTKKYAVPDITRRYAGSVPETYGLRDIIRKLAGSVPENYGMSDVGRKLAELNRRMMHPNSQPNMDRMRYVPKNHEQIMMVEREKDSSKRLISGISFDDSATPSEWLI